MAKESGQKFIRRVRPPRVHITYENPANAEEKVEIPFVMGVMADLSGNTPGVEKEELSPTASSSNSTWITSTLGWRRSTLECPSVSRISSPKIPASKWVCNCASIRWRISNRRQSHGRCQRSKNCWRRDSSWRT